VHRQRESVDRAPQPSIRLGLRILLATQLEQDAAALRQGILSGLVLQATKRSGVTSQIQVLAAVAEAIGLHRPIQRSYLDQTLRQLQEEGYIEVAANGDIRRREKAFGQMAEAADRAALRAVKGFCAFRQSLSHHFGDEISEQDFKRIWRAVQEGVVKLFQEYGGEFVEFVHALSASSGAVFSFQNQTPLHEQLQKIARCVDGLTLSISAPKELRRLARVLPEALVDSSFGVLEWLGQLCLAYVSACSLGLHPDALKRVEVRLRTWDVIPDTHIILSLLGRGESDHQDTVCLLQWWLQAGGKLLAIDPILSETRRHAGMAASMNKRWKDQCGRRRPGDTKVKTDPPQKNVFLRSAVAIYKDKLGPTGAERYIQQFLGRGDEDVTNIRRILESEFGFTTSPVLPLDDVLVENVYQQFAVTRLDGEYDYEHSRRNAEARCRHDAQALAYLAAYRESLKGTNRVAVILSHSTSLLKIHDAFHAALGFASPSIAPDRLMFAVSLCPGAPFTMRSLQATLFGTAFQAHVAQHEALARKVMEGLAEDNVRGLHTPALAAIVDEKLTHS
jgi:hypothetical protein